MSYLFKIELIEMDIFKRELFQLIFLTQKKKFFGKFEPISKTKLFTLLKLYKQSYYINKSITVKSNRK